jgi:phospholipase D3/4
MLNNLQLGTSLTQVKELGAVVESCELLARDTLKVMEMYWEAARLSAVPQPWPSSFDTVYNRTNPAQATLNGEAVDIFLSASPNQFDTPFRAHDGDTIVGNIDNSTSTLCIEVMDYYPFSEFMNPNFYWPVIDDAIRRAAWRGVKVRLLFSIWGHTPPEATQYWQSLDALHNVEVRAFVVPPLKGSQPIPFTRVNHAKMIVTDSLVYVGTSNLTPDYFINTGGLGWTIRTDVLRQQVQDIFDRDWNSQYAVMCCK